MTISLFQRQQGQKRSGRRDWPFLPRHPYINWDCGVNSNALAERVRARTVARSSPPAMAMEETPPDPPTEAETPNLGTATRTTMEALSPSSMLIVAAAQDLRSDWATELNCPSTKTVLGCKGGGSGLSLRSPALVLTCTREDDNNNGVKYRDIQPRRSYGGRPGAVPTPQLCIRPRKIPSPVISFRRMQRRIWVEEQAAILAKEDQAEGKAATSSISCADAISTTRPAGGAVLDATILGRPYLEVF